MLLYWPTLLTCTGADSRRVPDTPCSEKLQMRAAPCAYSLSALQSRASKRWHRSECSGQQFVILSTLWVICWGGGRKISSISSSIARQFSCTGVTLRLEGCNLSAQFILFVQHIQFLPFSLTWIISPFCSLFYFNSQHNTSKGWFPREILKQEIPSKRFKWLWNPHSPHGSCRTGYFLQFRHFIIIISNNTQKYMKLVSISCELSNMVQNSRAAFT